MGGGAGVGGYYVFFTRTIILISISYCAWITWSSRACLVCCVVVVVVLFPVYTINHDPPAVKWCCCCWSSTTAAFVHWRGVLCGGNGTGSAQFANNLKLFCRLVFLRVLWNWLCTCYVRASSVCLAGWLADSSSRRRRLVLFPSRAVDIERPTEVRGIIFIPASIFNYPCRSAMPVSQWMSESVVGRFESIESSMPWNCFPIITLICIHFHNVISHKLLKGQSIRFEHPHRTGLDITGTDSLPPVLSSWHIIARIFIIHVQIAFVIIAPCQENYHIIKTSTHPLFFRSPPPI